MFNQGPDSGRNRLQPPDCPARNPKDVMQPANNQMVRWKLRSWWWFTPTGWITGPKPGSGRVTRRAAPL